MKIPGAAIEIRTLPFYSESWALLPGSETYSCSKHGVSFTEDLSVHKQPDAAQYPDVLKYDDRDIPENREFRYSVFMPASHEKAKSAIFLFHGLNEKYWQKYLPWAEALVERTGRAVVLFPIALHMNRAPMVWTDSRLMHEVTIHRKTSSPSITNSTFANAAISARLQMVPQRFFWSGLQTFYDISKLIGTIRKGEHPLISSDARIDLFAYSIGSFLSEILMMSNTKNYFDDSKLFMFCGGPTLDRMSPNSKFILDSDATIAIYSYYTERLESELKRDPRLAHYFTGAHGSGKYFKALLSYRKEKEFRENRFRELHDRIAALALNKDGVAPPNEVLNTLTGDSRNIPIHVDVQDFPYPYNHVTPFPSEEKYEMPVNECFQQVFNLASEFLQ
jgi:hypothetical protein